jgi:hypothetical protein
MLLEIYDKLSEVKKQIKSICCRLKLIEEGQQTEPKYKVYTALLTQSGGDNAQTLEGGPLTKGVSYVFDYAEGTWDFTNVGGPKYPDTTSFVATANQEPIDWANTGLNFNTGAPVVTVLENTIGNIWFTYAGTGTYDVKSNNLFIDNKTTFSINLMGEDIGTGYFCLGDILDESTNRITTGSPDVGEINDVLTYKTPIEIRVYN